MKINNGSLTYEDYQNLYKNKNILSKSFTKNQIQPSSVDLTLSDECYEISASFLSSKSNVREFLKKVRIKKIDLNNKYIFKKNRTFIVKLNESLNLSKNIFGICNPKSSTGRLDIFCRTILNFSNEYEKIPLSYNGEMFIEITSRSFDIEFQKNDSLNQMRLFFNKHEYVNDIELEKFHNDFFLTKNKKNNRIKPDLNNGLKISVDLSSDNLINAYVAKIDTPKLIFKKIKFHKINDFWDPIKSIDNKIINIRALL